MFREVVEKYYAREMNNSCSEAVIKAANEYYGLNISEEMIKAASAFSGGCCGNMCGALASGSAVIGILYSNGHAHDSAEMKEKVNELTREFAARLGTINCTALKMKYKTPEKRCSDIVLAAADIIEELLSEKKND